MSKKSITYTCQSVYRHGDMKTTLLRVLSDLVVASGCGKVSVLTLADLSTAFYTIDLHILLDCLQNCGSALSWFLSYLPDRQ